MASLLNNASLLLNPAGSIIAYEEDKILSVLPRNGAGDFTFSGGDGGTRVNQQGYIEQTPANFMLNSGTTWTPFNVTVTTGVTDPVGGTGAYTIGSIASGNVTEYAVKSSNVISLLAGTTFTYSIYMKGSGTIATYVERSIAGTYWIDYKTHTLSSEWQVFTHSFTVPTNASGVNVYVGNLTGTTATSVDIAFPMLNYGSSAKPYQPTTDRLNYPRITYQNGRGALLSEPQRTNLTQGSNGLTTNWTNYRGTYTANAISSPDGTVNAPRTVWDSSSPNSVGFYFQNFTFASSTTYCFSVFLKYYNKPIISVGYIDRSGPFLGGNAYFNIANGTFVSVDGSATTGIIEPYQDGWYRCTVVFTTVASPSYNYLAIDSGTVVTGEGFYVYGSQLEIGEFPTSYTPTTSATVTRPMDQFSKDDSPALSTTSWTFYMSGVNIGKNQNSSGGTIDDVNWSFDSGAGPYGPNSLHNYNNTVYYYDTVNGAANLGAIGNTTTKFAVTKNGTTFKFFRNGVLFSTNVLSLASNVWDSFRMYCTTDAQGQAFSNNPSTLAIIPSALSDSDAQTLTTVRSGSGGNISYYGPYTIHTFTGSATFTPSFNGQVEVLVVAGGGGGGQNHGGGGGGAGGLLYASSYGVSAGSGITVTVGSGGAIAGNGSNSVFGGLTTIGGGLGASEGANNGGNGGSGGGGTGFSTATNGGSGIPGQGFDGGKGGFPDTSGVYGSGGGGGGASAPGTDGKEGVDVSGSAGNGGNGLPYSITGFSTYYAGGGGGGYWGSNLAYYGVGGLGGGGNGGAGISTTLLPTPGVNGLGGGGGGSRGDGSQARPGSIGGSGVVIVRYLT